MLAMVGMLTVPAPAAAKGGTLQTTARPVLWSGAVTRGGGYVGEVPECAAGCDRFDLAVSLPGGAWTQKPGSLQIAIRWQGGIFGDNLRLYVYRGGQMVAKSDGIIAIAQGVLIPSAPDGLYRIYAAYDPDSTSNPLAYEGVAEVEYEPKVHPTRLLMPDLEARPQRNLGFDPVGIFFDEISAASPSCYQSEVDEEAARLCLRFDQIFANTGEGAMELRFALPTGTTPPVADVYQHVYASDDASNPSETLAGQVAFHPAHGHYHFSSFGLSRLYAAGAPGSKATSTPLRQRRMERILAAPATRTGRKVSFCLADTEIDAWGRKGDGARTYIAPDCLFPASSDGVNDYFVQGITRGWGDIYDFYLPDQYLDVYGLADGDYVLENVADPDALLRETTRENNCTSILIRLSGLATTTPGVAVLGPGPACQP